MMQTHEAITVWLAGEDLLQGSSYIQSASGCDKHLLSLILFPLDTHKKTNETGR